LYSNKEHHTSRAQRNRNVWKRSTKVSKKRSLLTRLLASGVLTQRFRFLFLLHLVSFLMLRVPLLQFKCFYSVGLSVDNTVVDNVSGV